ncbi:LysR family transcriptional regulator [Frigidibacter sp. ROC022]|uniref:LysR family transcriptional regulator n=1 Tax=Frigidibacter sp. ROC022 TaxID=2971796 RepID=UPI00215B2234|nr:LysR family transcriptional regulator [Frigidibacter sp. ROC022]MCR8725739.1 LysR family transcriptional regulator [Frigidibacter sp. ROC022]
MELVWLEDFLEIVAARNFSTAAAARNISQSAFSRRIKSLETWVGADLIDRSTYPVRLTAAGEMFLPRAQELARDIYRLRTDCRNLGGTTQAPLNFAALHTLAIYFFPEWFGSLGTPAQAQRSSMHAGDFLECIEQLSLGKSDFALVYDHPQGLPVLEAGPFESQKVGTDRLIPVSGTDAAGQPLYPMDRPDSDTPIPYLAYTWNDGYLGKLIGLILSRRKKPLNLTTVYQSSMAEGLKQMAVAGHGIAWVPRICVQGELERGALVQIGDPAMALDIEIRLFRRSGYRGREGEEVWARLADANAGPPPVTDSSSPLPRPALPSVAGSR